jgi:hypothetical protein
LNLESEFTNFDTFGVQSALQNEEVKHIADEKTNFIEAVFP